MGDSTAVIRREFASKILRAYDTALESIFEVGHLLTAAKDAIPRGEFLDMVDSDLPFSVSTAERLMKIAGDARLNEMPMKALPPRWSVLYELTKLDDTDFEQLRPNISTDMRASDVRKVNGRGRDLSAPVDVLEFNFPTPPTINQLIQMAKGRWGTHKYKAERDKYYTHCDMLVAAKQMPAPPKTPWPRWRIEGIDYRIWEHRDFIELMAGLKWPADWLVLRGYVKDDSPRELVPPLPWPSVVITRGDNRGVTVVIRRAG